MASRRTKLEVLGATVSLATIVALSVAVLGAGSEAPPVPTPAPSPSPSPREVTLAKVGGVFAAVPDRTITDPTLLPYPFMSPTPSPEPTEIDGTYLRTIDLKELGGARIGLPYRCLRCPPYRIDAGVSTLVLYRGAYYIHHHLSGFKTMGSFVLEGERITLFNDANCPQKPGVYAFEHGPHAISFEVVRDDCPFSGERSFDLMAEPWVRVSACFRRIENLWPGEVAC